ncbi:MAG: M20/M25/M40 family metallo-hydrolase, partial [Acidimicrobiia bacterium]|nr:M20/M25/M40 family metallo-hydrolase [Acidimicrobiia bacterium]
VFGPDYERLETVAEVDHPANSSPTTGPLWEAIGDGIESMTGSRRVVPALTPATTDARFFRARGTKAYGVAMFDDLDDFSSFLSMFHGNDERVSVASLGASRTLLARVVERFSERIGG